MNLKFFFGSLLAVPLLPVMFYQGKKIRSSVPKLPEATGTEGTAGIESAAKRELRLLTIGESTIAGVGAGTHEEGFTGTFAKALSEQFNTNVKWRVYARSGYTAKMVTHKIIDKIEETDPDLVVIGLGGNDAFTLNPPTSWKKDILQLLSKLRQRFPDALIVFCNMPPIKEFPAFTPLIKFVLGNHVEILGRELEKITDQQPNVYYDSRRITLADWIQRLNLDVDPADFFSDGVHPSRLTYQTWAKDLASTIREHQPSREILDALLGKK